MCCHCPLDHNRIKTLQEIFEVKFGISDRPSAIRAPPSTFCFGQLRFRFIADC